MSISLSREIEILKAKNKALLSFIKMTFIAGGGSEQEWAELERKLNGDTEN